MRVWIVLTDLTVLGVYAKEHEAQEHFDSLKDDFQSLRIVVSGVRGL